MHLTCSGFPWVPSPVSPHSLKATKRRRCGKAHDPRHLIALLSERGPLSIALQCKQVRGRGQCKHQEDHGQQVPRQQQVQAQLREAADGIHNQADVAARQALHQTQGESDQYSSKACVRARLGARRGVGIGVCVCVCVSGGVCVGGCAWGGAKFLCVLRRTHPPWSVAVVKVGLTEAGGKEKCTCSLMTIERAHDRPCMCGISLLLGDVDGGVVRGHGHHCHRATHMPERHQGRRRTRRGLRRAVQAEVWAAEEVRQGRRLLQQHVPQEQVRGAVRDEPERGRRNTSAQPPLVQPC